MNFELIAAVAGADRGASMPKTRPGTGTGSGASTPTPCPCRTCQLLLHLFRALHRRYLFPVRTDPKTTTLYRPSRALRYNLPGSPISFLPFTVSPGPLQVTPGQPPVRFRFPLRLPLTQRCTLSQDR